MGSESMLSKKTVVWILQQQTSASSLWKAWLVRPFFETVLGGCIPFKWVIPPVMEDPHLDGGFLSHGGSPKSSIVGYPHVWKPPRYARWVASSCSSRLVEISSGFGSGNM